MDKKSVFIVFIIAMLLTLALSFIFADFKTRLTGLTVNTYLEDLEIGKCIKTGEWDEENSNYKLTKCPSNLIMKGAGIAVTKDLQSGGSAWCCDGSLEYYDCEEESRWEKDLQDYTITFCSKERPFMKGVGIKVKGGQQAGGKAYCCKAKDVELYNCAVTSYWKDTNQNHKLTVCPEERPIMSGAGFSVRENYQNGGKAYCCAARVRLSGTKGDVEVIENVGEEEGVEVVDAEEVKEETEAEKASGAEGGGFCEFAKKIFC